MMPIGVPTKVASSTITNEPKIALAMPPASLGGGVISVSVAQVRPPTPRRTVSQRIHTSQKTPKAIAASDSVSATWLTRLRRANLAARVSSQRLGVQSGVARASRSCFRPFALAACCASSSLDSDSTTKVMKNSTRPR